MKVVVDKLPESPEKCMFSRIKDGKLACELDFRSPISSCRKTKYCPWLMTVDDYLNKRIREYYDYASVDR